MSYDLMICPNFNDGNTLYCRVAQAVIPSDAAICAECPLTYSDAPKEETAPCFYYADKKIVETATKESDPALVENEIRAGRDTRFPRFCRKETDSLKPLEKALQFAAVAHAGTTRKGTKIPYILHPAEAAFLVLRYFREKDASGYAPEEIDIAAAAALHDVLEDTETTYEKLKETFGARVADLVREESEDKRENLPAASTWKTRKQEFLDALENAPREAQIITLADKLSNLRAIARDYQKLGDALWERFNQKDPAEHAWYYYGIAVQLAGHNHSGVYQEYDHLCREVFGGFFI